MPKTTLRMPVEGGLGLSQGGKAWVQGRGRIEKAGLLASASHAATLSVT